MNDSDDVACLLDAASVGDEIEVRDSNGFVVDTVLANADIPRFHKVALRDLGVGEQLRKYGETIGIVSSPITRGDYVHVHNLVSAKVGAGR
ncbi:MAG: UxaA family hydrolase [Olsenella sp.]|jgi:hypothetical protein|nr:UxaA family hydrolase [Olsenella sp.]MCI1644969.1 UxaA family hydrolase [Olsenella sp.]MCI1792802.1 UxaA family hydrolase [Olsenella sp.]MCI1810810.1 UxaA family hydrolase [Olsenella sp.]MCI1878935.1 UxaA family hydrolase [Olsenella sp.]